MTPTSSPLPLPPTHHRTGAVAALALATLMQILPAGPAAATEFNLPQGPNRALIYAKCRTCHDLQYVVESKGMNASAWDGLIDDMEGFGVDLTPDERKKIVTYLQTYMGDTPPPAPSATPEVKTKVDGASVFAENCTACHQEDAKGIPETFPPLAHNSDLFLARLFPVKVLLNGMTGALRIKGAPYEGEMPSFSHLSDAELAAVVNYLRQSFGNDALATKKMAAVTADDVKKLRQSPMDPEKVLEYRASLE